MKLAWLANDEKSYAENNQGLLMCRDRRMVTAGVAGQISPTFHS
jgi:hypothetical protein